LTVTGFDATSKLAMRESVAEGLLPQKPTNKAVLLTGGKTLVRVFFVFLNDFIMIKYGVNNIVEFVWGDDFLCYALSGVILEVVADGSIFGLFLWHPSVNRSIRRHREWYLSFL
ncbi:hypothetical protein EDB80DRAFT_590446, partial [Ilyonectria destructans]